ncbi:MAG: hypothetical protein ABIE23_03000 [archaeon]|nr:hypothetical protein [Candidatus Micrarchaeota archaeon]
MIAPLLNSIKLMVSKPFFIVIALIVALINSFVLFFFQETLFEFILSLMDVNAFPTNNLLILPFQLVSIYFNELLILLLVLFVSVLLNVFLFFAFADYVGGIKKKKASFGASLGYAIKSLFEQIKLVVFFVVLVAFGFLVLWMFFLLSVYTVFGGILLIIAMLLCIYLVIKFIFTPAIMATEKIKLKESLKKSYEFSGKHFFEIILLLIVLFIVNALVEVGIGYYIVLAQPEENFFLVIDFIITLLLTAYFTLLFPVYYQLREKNAGL